MSKLKDQESGTIKRPTDTQMLNDILKQIPYCTREQAEEISKEIDYFFPEIFSRVER
jgi:hypothetical protein